MHISFRLTTIVFIACLVFPCYSFSQQSEFDRLLLPGTPVSESVNLYEISSYPQNWTITKDWDGNLLVGTLGNLMIYDGARWTRRTLPGNTTRSLVPGFNRRIYVGGTNEFGYLERDDSAFVDNLNYVSLRDRVTEEFSNVDRVHKVVVSGDSTVFFNGSFHTYKYQNDSLKPLSEDVWVFRVFDVNGKIVTNDSLGISIYKDGSLDLIPEANEFEYIGIYCIQPIEDDQFIFTVGGRGLFRYNGTAFSEIESDASEFFKQHTVSVCSLLPDGSYLIGTQGAGALRINANGDILGWYNRDNGLPENRIYGIHTEFDGTVWLSHFNHITKMDLGLPLRVVNESSGFNSIPFSMVYRNDEIYLGTRSGVYKSNLDLNFNFTFEQLMTSTSILKLIEFQDELLIYSNREIFNSKNPSVSIFSFPNSVNTLEVSRVNNNLLFAASNVGLNLIRANDDGRLESTPLISSLNYDEAQFVQNENGDLWIGSSSGTLVKLPYSEIERFLIEGSADLLEYQMPEGWRGDGSRRIALLKLDDEVLLGTPRGLYKIDKETDTVVEDDRFGEWSRVNDHGRPNPILRMAADNEGNVWMRGSRNYQYAERQPDGSYNVHYNILKRVDDDLSNEIIPLGDGKVWFLGSKGLVYYDHNLVTQRDVRPPIIRRVTVNNDSLVYLGYSREKSESNRLTLEYKNNDLRFEFGLPDFSTFEGSEYQVKLEGFDDDWSVWSLEAQKDYTQVREGRYRFLVRAKDITGVVTQASVLPIRILPPWYRTIWAYFLYLALISLVLYSIHKYRINKILAIQKVRNRIASDLHDEVSSTLSSITFFTEAIQKNKEKEKALRYLNLISTSAGEAKEKMSDIIWSIDPDHDNWENLITKCKRFAADMFESKNIQYDLEFPKNISGKIEIEMRQNIWLMFKEIVTNIARHSKTERAEIKVSFSGNHLHIKILDHGVGFDPENARNGNGLENIRRRAADLKGSATVKAEKDEGAEWIIHIPI